MKVKLLLVLILFAWPLGAQEPEGLPRELKYRVVENFFQLPDSIWLSVSRFAQMAISLL